MISWSSFISKLTHKLVCQLVTIDHQIDSYLSSSNRFNDWHTFLTQNYAKHNWFSWSMVTKGLELLTRVYMFQFRNTSNIPQENWIRTICNLVRHKHIFYIQHRIYSFGLGWLNKAVYYSSCTQVWTSQLVNCST